MIFVMGFRLSIVLRLVRVGPDVASEKVSRFQSTDGNRVKGSRIPMMVGSKVQGYR